jgi:hypothetical protein
MGESVIVTVSNPGLGQTTGVTVREVVTVAGPKGDKGNTGAAGDTFGSLDVRLDKTAAPVYYIGEAQPGSNEGAALWRIKKVDNSGDVLTILFAGGHDRFEHVWTDHLTLTYS